MSETILITGANGQLGSVLTNHLAQLYGDNNIIATDISTKPDSNTVFERLDVTDGQRMAELVQKYQVTQVYHLAAILSAKGEENPMLTWDINTKGLFNVLEIARQYNHLKKIFHPSSIAVYGDKTPKLDTPQHTVLNPSTVYGISKLAGEHWSNYYHQKYGVDIRSVRYPGLVGYQSMPGGGTTDYAVEIYHEAIANGQYTCPLSADTALPMLYMEDAIRGTIELMDAPAHQIKERTSYNLSAMSFTPAQMAVSIQKHIPNFEIFYKNDTIRQAIADSWSDSIDDSAARKDWAWQPQYDLDRMTAEMIKHLKL